MRYVDTVWGNRDRLTRLQQPLKNQPGRQFIDGLNRDTMAPSNPTPRNVTERDGNECPQETCTSVFTEAFLTLARGGTHPHTHQTMTQ